MATRDEHLRKARHNEDLADYLLSNDAVYRDWAVCGAFYAAVHYVEAYLAGYGGGGYHNVDHVRRGRLIHTIHQLEGIRREYSHLKNAGWAARYVVKTFTRDEVSDLREMLQAVKGQITRLL